MSPFCAFEFRFLELDGRARMQVAQARQQIGQVIAPQQFRAHRLNVILHAIEDGAKLVFWVVQKTDEQFHRAIARAAAQTGHGGVQIIGALDDAFDGVGVGQLQIIMRMHADFLARRFAMRKIFLDHVAHLLAVKRAETVDQINRFDFGFGQHFQALRPIPGPE